MRKVWIGGIGLMVLALALPMCTGVPMTAPSGSDIFLNANPTFVPANGGVSVITAVVTEPAGTPPPNGTVIFFFTDLGRVDAQGKTKDGIARVNFVSDSRWGTAKVTAVSGGAAAPPASPTPTPSATPPTVHLWPSLFEMAVALAASNTNSIPIVVGAPSGTKGIVVASPSRISSPGSALITANVFDPAGNPLANVPVIFTLASVSSAPSPAPPGAIYETLDSGGVPQFTDTNGQAFDTLRTRAPLGLGQRTVIIKANLPVGTSVDGLLSVVS